MRKDPTEFRKRFAAWKDGKKPYDGGRIAEVVITPDLEYNLFLNTLPDNQRLTPEENYTTHRYWELNDKPKNFSLAIQKGMYTMEPDGWHANTVLENKKTGEIEFMKPWNHSSIGYEYNWYRSSDPEAVEFRKQYKHVPSAPNAKYVPRFKDGKLPRYGDGTKPVVLNNYTNAKFNDDGTFTDDTTKVFDDFYVTPSGVKTKYGSYTDKNWDRYKQQEAFFRTHDQQTGNLKYEPGLEIVSPEYDLISGIRGILQMLPLVNKNASKKVLPRIVASENTDNPYKLQSGESTKDLFEKMRSIQIRSKLALIKSPESDPVNDPYGITNLTSDVIHYEGMPKGVEDIFRYLILPRTNINPINYDNTINMLSRYGYNVLDDYNWAKYVGDNLAGYLDNSTYGIALREGYIRNAGAHEFRHRMQKLVKDKPSLMIDRKAHLDKAYGDDFVNLPKNVDEHDSLFGYPFMEDEAATTNLDARKWAFENFTDNPNIAKASIKELNDFLDNLTDDQIIIAVAHANGYGRRYVHFLELKYDLLNNDKLNARYANWFRNAMKYYGSAAIPVGVAYSMQNNTQNELRNK